MSEYNVDDIKDLTGFEAYLHGKGFRMYATNTYFNTYNSCARSWSKGEECIVIGLMDIPTRVGVTHPYVVDMIEHPEGDRLYVTQDGIKKKMVVKDFSFLPSEDQYEEYLNRLTNG